MRVGLVATLATLVRAVGSGSVEGLTFLLARELAAQGHEVTVFAAAGSSVPGCTVVPVAGRYGAPGMPEDYQQCELLNLVRALEHGSRMDVLHSHGYLLGRLVEPLATVPMVHTLHTQPHGGEIALVDLLPEISLTALSAYQWEAFPQVRPVVIPHAVDAAAFSFRARPERRLCYLGRFTPGKGPLEAIRVAREVGLPLVMAGPETDYFHEVVRPHVDGASVEFVGFVQGADRDALLGGSAALLYPMRDAEPFGLVLAEAAMCGTPVVATAVGAVAEVVDDGVTGRVVGADGLAGAVPEALAFDRRRIRSVAERRFSAARMARQYLEVYEAAVDSGISRLSRMARALR